MCAEELSESKMHGTEKVKSTWEQGRCRSCVRAAVCADSAVPGRVGCALKAASFTGKAPGWMRHTWV